jgi:hypothetical protein
MESCTQGYVVVQLVEALRFRLEGHGFYSQRNNWDFFFVGVQEKLGILNSGVVYAVYDYEAHNSDELSFKEGDKLIVLRKGDEWEREWWWSRLSDQEGYIPRNLLGVCVFLEVLVM